MKEQLSFAGYGLRSPRRPDIQTRNVSPLRTIYRLRSGLPPAEHLQDLTTGAEALLARSRSLFDTGNDTVRWMQVTGDYGQGKSHTLTLLKELAQQQNYATCYLSCDGSASALNHPQRFLPVLVSTLTVPGHTNNGYQDLLFELLGNRESAEALNKIVHRRVSGSHTLAAALRWHLAQLLQAHRTISDDRARHTQAVVLTLSGQSIRHRSGAPPMRRFAYELLQVTVDVVTSLGGNGLVLLVDELESIYTKLPNSRSRHGAYRVLAALCESPVFTHCRIVLAVTSDASRWLAASAPTMQPQPGDLDSEPVRRWADRIEADLPAVACPRLDRRGRAHLLHRIREFYLNSYPRVRERWNDEAWKRFADDLLARAVPVRLIMRETIDFLDSLRYAGA